MQHIVFGLCVYAAKKVCMYVWVCLCICMCHCVCVCVCVCVCMCVCMCMCVYVCVCVCGCLCVCICVTIVRNSNSSFTFWTMKDENFQLGLSPTLVKYFCCLTLILMVWSWNWLILSIYFYKCILFSYVLGAITCSNLMWSMCCLCNISFFYRIILSVGEKNGIWEECEC